MAIGEVRCFCSRQPLMGLIKVRNGKPIVHVKTYKQNRIYCEMELTSGSMRIRCRECLRWHEVTIVKDEAKVVPVEEVPNRPASVAR